MLFGLAGACRDTQWKEICFSFFVCVCAHACALAKGLGPWAQQLSGVHVVHVSIFVHVSAKHRSVACVCVCVSAGMSSLCVCARARKHKCVPGSGGISCTCVGQQKQCGLKGVSAAAHPPLHIFISICVQIVFLCANDTAATNAVAYSDMFYLQDQH